MELAAAQLAELLSPHPAPASCGRSDCCTDLVALEFVDRPSANATWQAAVLQVPRQVL